MPEEDGKTFGEAYELYAKWRSVEINSLEQWLQITREMYEFIERNGCTPLAVRLAVGIMDTFDDLYKNGMKPVVLDYFGRSDL